MRLNPFRSLVRDERGSTLIAVVGLSLITAVIAVSVSTVSVNALATTGSARAGVQAQAAAESGIAATVAALNTAACQPTYTRTSAPAYSVAISWAATSSGPWTVGCPTAVGFIRLVSSGSAYTDSLGGLATGRYVEAIYGYTPTAVTGITPSGAAVYSYASSGSSITGLTLNAATTARPSVQVYTGDLNCASNTTINGDLAAANGNVILSASNCVINGNVSASKGVDIEGTVSVNGNVSASGLLSTGDSYRDVTPGVAVSGNVIAAGRVTIQGKVGGSVTAGPGTGASFFENGMTIGGSLAVAGSLDADGATKCAAPLDNPTTDSASAKCSMQASPKWVGGTISYGVTGMTAPTAPVVPGWTDYNYKASDWVGYNIVTLTTNDCNWSWSDSTGIAALNAAAASSTPTVLDARACTNISMYYAANPVLHSNLVIVAKSFDLGANTWTSSSATQRDLWFIVPDSGTAGQPNTPCNTGGTVNINSGFNVSGTVTGMVYTPGQITNSTTTWRGQMYSCNTVMNQGQTINFEPLGLPGVNLDAGSGSASAGGSSTGLGKLSATPTSYRDVSSAG